MVIKIIKKRNVPDPVRPAPVVAEPAPVAEKPKPAPIQHTPTPKVEPTICKLCEHPYIKPCHGEDTACMNRQWVRARLAAAKD